MAYAARSDGALDYEKCQYGTSKLLFRGPKRATRGSHIAFVGGSETFGKYVETPFVDQVEAAIGKPCFNFGTMNAGIDAFRDDTEILNYCIRADATVVQVMGAQNMSNRFYSVHPRRNDRFIKASAVLKSIFREVDFTEFAFTKHMLITLDALDPQRFVAIRTELQKAWVARMKSFLKAIPNRKLLLWVSRRMPDTPADRPSEAHDPLFITREMIDALVRDADDYVEVVVNSNSNATGLEGMQFPPMELQSAREMPGPEVHDLVTKRLLQYLK